MHTNRTKYFLSAFSSIVTCLIVLFLWTKVAKAEDLLGDGIPAGKIVAKAPVAQPASTVAATPAAPAPIIEQPKPEPKKPAPVPVTEKDSKVSLYLKLDELRSQNAILTEALKNEKLRKEINDSNKGGGTYVPGITSTFGGVEQPRQSNDTTTSNALQVQMVGGTGDNLYAQISLATGGRQTIHVGSNINGLGTVQSISLNEVVVVNKKQTIILPFASETLSSPNGMR